MDFKDGWFPTADGPRLYYRDYAGPSDAGSRVPVLCLHGLTRNAADFEDLAPHLAARRRVLALDVRGRGRSDPDPEPGRYHAGTYVGDVSALLAALGIPRVILIGTSMGGIIGMIYGAMNAAGLAGLVLNDIGPEIDPRGLARIRGYVGRGGPVASWAEAAAAVRAINEIAFPDADDAFWDRFARRTYREEADGRIVPAYDPRIADAMAQAGAAPADMWPMFDLLAEIPILVIRGAHSDILSAETLAAMQQRHPDLESVTVPGRGHAPALDEPEAVAAIDAFLARLP